MLPLCGTDSPRGLGLHRSMGMHEPTSPAHATAWSAREGIAASSRGVFVNTRGQVLSVAVVARSPHGVGMSSDGRPWSVAAVVRSARAAYYWANLGGTQHVAAILADAVAI